MVQPISGPSEGNQFVKELSALEKKERSNILEPVEEDPNEEGDVQVTINSSKSSFDTSGEEEETLTKGESKLLDRNELTEKGVAAARDTVTQPKGDPPPSQLRPTFIVNKDPKELRAQANESTRKVKVREDENKVENRAANRDVKDRSLARIRKAVKDNTISPGSSEFIRRKVLNAKVGEHGNPAIKEDSVSAGRKPLYPDDFLDESSERPDPQPLVDNVKKENAFKKIIKDEKTIMETNDVQRVKNVERRQLNIDVQEINEAEKNILFKEEDINDATTEVNFKDKDFTKKRVIANNPPTRVEDPLSGTLKTFSLLEKAEGKEPTRSQRFDDFA